MRVVPKPKDMSPLAVRTPIRIAGTYKDPKARPEAGPLLLRGAAAVALYAIMPPAALLALIETGPGSDTDCKAKGGNAGQTGDGAAQRRQDKRDAGAAKAGAASGNKTAAKADDKTGAKAADKTGAKAADKTGAKADDKAGAKAADARESRK